MDVTFNPKPKTMVVQLGHIGDILSIIPAMVHLGLRDILVCRRYLDIVLGFSYLQPYIWDGDIEDLAGACGAAMQHADRILVPQLFGLHLANYPPKLIHDALVWPVLDCLRCRFHTPGLA